MSRLARTARALAIAAAVPAAALGIGVLGAAPASASTAGLLPSCTSAPVPQAPASGIAGWFMPAPAHPPAPGNWAGPDATTTEYDQYGFAGLGWSTYDLGCVSINATPPLTTGIGNVFMSLAEAVVSDDSDLHSWASSPAWLSKLNPIVTASTRTVHQDLFTPWAGLAVTIVALTLMLKAGKSDLPGSVTMAGWALLVLTLVAGVTAYPTWAGRQAEALMGSTINAMDAGFVGPAGQADATNLRASLLTSSVLYPLWLRGEVGTSDTALARRDGPELLEDQALTWRQAAGSQQEITAITNAKEAAFAKVAAGLKAGDPQAYSTLQGKDGSRWGTGLIALFLALVTCAFDAFAAAVVIVALLSVLVAVIVLPALAIAGIHHGMRHHILGLLSRVAGMLVSGLLYSAGAGIDTRATQLLLDSHLLPLPLTMLILAFLPLAIFIAIRRARAGRVIPRAALYAAGVAGLGRWTSRAAERGAERGAGEGDPDGRDGFPSDMWWGDMRWRASRAYVIPGRPALPDGPPALPPPGPDGGGPAGPVTPPGGGGGGPRPRPWPRPRPGTGPDGPPNTGPRRPPPGGNGSYPGGGAGPGGGGPVINLEQGPDGVYSVYDGGDMANAGGGAGNAA